MEIPRLPFDIISLIILQATNEMRADRKKKWKNVLEVIDDRCAKKEEISSLNRGRVINDMTWADRCTIDDSISWQPALRFWNERHNQWSGTYDVTLPANARIEYLRTRGVEDVPSDEESDSDSDEEFFVPDYGEHLPNDQLSHDGQLMDCAVERNMSDNGMHSWSGFWHPNKASKYGFRNIRHFIPDPDGGQRLIGSK